jgi:uncharacterized protein
MPGRSTSAAADVLLDTGVLVAVFDQADPRHATATRWLAGFDGQLHTVEPVLAEAGFFLPPRLRPALADLAAGGTLRLHQPDATGLRRIGAILRKYEDLDPDWADATLVWLAEELGVQRIATVDSRDFSTYRVHGRTRFILEPLT